MQVHIPLLLHGLFKAAVQNLVEGADPLLHLCLTVCSQKERALILHLQLEGEPTHFAVLKDDITSSDFTDSSINGIMF